MIKSFLEILSLGLLLLVPALIYSVSVNRHGDLTVEYLSIWFLGNYIFMALPHFLMLGASIFGPMPRSVLKITLIVLNTILVLFQCWIWFVVPGRESGLAWIFYIPAWIIGLTAIYGYYYFVERQNNKD